MSAREDFERAAEAHEKAGRWFHSSVIRFFIKQIFGIDKPRK